MSCVVCRGEERFMLGDFENALALGYVERGCEDADDLQVPYLDVFLLIKETNEPDNYHHQQILSTCPVCGEQLCDDATKDSMIKFYNALHEKRVEIRNSIFDSE